MTTAKVLFFQFFLCILLTSCASNFDADLKKIQVGDDKARVLELLGSPRRAIRLKDIDRWTYTYQADGQEQVKIIDFQNGKVIKTAEKQSNDGADVTPENAETYEDYEKSILKRRKK